MPVLARRRQPSPDNFVESAPSEDLAAPSLGRLWRGPGMGSAGRAGQMVGIGAGVGRGSWEVVSGRVAGRSPRDTQQADGLGVR